MDNIIVICSNSDELPITDSFYGLTRDEYRILKSGGEIKVRAIPERLTNILIEKEMEKEENGN